MPERYWVLPSSLPGNSSRPPKASVANRTSTLATMLPADRGAACAGAGQGSGNAAHLRRQPGVDHSRAGTTPAPPRGRPSPICTASWAAGPTDEGGQSRVRSLAQVTTLTSQRNIRVLDARPRIPVVVDRAGVRGDRFDRPDGFTPWRAGAATWCLTHCRRDPALPAALHRLLAGPPVRLPGRVTLAPFRTVGAGVRPVDSGT